MKVKRLIDGRVIHVSLGGRDHYLPWEVASNLARDLTAATAESPPGKQYLPHQGLPEEISWYSLRDYWAIIEKLTAEGRFPSTGRICTSCLAPSYIGLDWPIDLSTCCLAPLIRPPTPADLEANPRALVWALNRMEEDHG